MENTLIYLMISAMAFLLSASSTMSARYSMIPSKLSSSVKYVAAIISINLSQGIKVTLCVLIVQRYLWIQIWVMRQRLDVEKFAYQPYFKRELYKKSNIKIDILFIHGETVFISFYLNFYMLRKLIIYYFLLETVHFYIKVKVIIIF